MARFITDVPAQIPVCLLWCRNEGDIISNDVATPVNFFVRYVFLTNRRRRSLRHLDWQDIFFSSKELCRHVHEKEERENERINKQASNLPTARIRFIRSRSIIIDVKLKKISLHNCRQFEIWDCPTAHALRRVRCVSACLTVLSSAGRGTSWLIFYTVTIIASASAKTFSVCPVDELTHSK